MGKMLIPKPFIVVKILDSDRVLLDIIKLCLPWGREVGGADNKIMECPRAWEKTHTNLGTEKSTACMFTKAQLIDVQTSAK